MRNSAGLPGAFRRAGDFFVLRRTWENMERNGKSLGKMFESKTNVFEKFPNDVMADGIKFYN